MLDSILNFFPKGGDSKRSLTSSISDVKLTISDLMGILEHVFTDGIGVDKCKYCEPDDENILDLSLEQANKRANLDCKCTNCGKPKTKNFKYVILEAPTGIGKSWIASWLALWKKNVTILTSQKGLQDQYKEDFPFVKTVRGRDNYDCLQLLNQEKCSQGHCFNENKKKWCDFHVSQDDFKIPDKGRGTENENIIYIGQERRGLEEPCKFYEQRVIGQLSSFSVYNYTMFLFSTLDKDEPEQEPELGHKTLLICDEAHDFEGYLKTNLGLEIKDTYATKIDRKDLQDRINLVKTTSNIDEILKIIRDLMSGYRNRIMEIKEHVDCSLWLYSKKHMMKHPELTCSKGHKRPQKKDCCKNARDFLRAFGKSRRCFKCKDHIPPFWNKESRTWDPCKEDHNKLNHLLLKSMKENLEDLETAYTEIIGDKNNFYVSKAGIDDDTGKFIVKLYPLKLQKEAKRVYEPYDNVLFMSATIDNHAFPEDVGLSPSDTIRIHLDSPFEKHNRKLIRRYVASLRYKNKEQEMLKIIKEIEKILDEHPEERGLIFVTSYSYQDMIMKGISQKYLERIFEIKRGENKTKKLDEFKSYKNKVAISPGLWFGYDFKDELSRFQIIVKAPYAPLDDQRTKAKMKRLDHGEYWYDLLACQKLVQGCGRSIRHKNDHAVTYLLDKRIQVLLDKPQTQKWFSDAVEGPETII